MTTGVTLLNQTAEDALHLAMFQDITNKNQLGDDRSVFVWQVIPPVNPNSSGAFDCSDDDAFEVRADAGSRSASLPIQRGDTNAIYGLYEVTPAADSLSITQVVNEPGEKLQISVKNQTEGTLEFAITRNGKPTFQEDLPPYDTLVTDVFSPGLYVICVPEGVGEGGWFKLSECVSNIASVQPGETLKVIRTPDGLQIQAQ